MPVERRCAFVSHLLPCLVPAAQLTCDTPGRALRYCSYSPEKKGLDERTKSGGKERAEEARKRDDDWP